MLHLHLHGLEDPPVEFGRIGGKRLQESAVKPAADPGLRPVAEGGFLPGGEGGPGGQTAGVGAARGGEGQQRAGHFGLQALGHTGDLGDGDQVGVVEEEGDVGTVPGHPPAFQREVQVKEIVVHPAAARRRR